jgi:hypothetical protein
MIKKSFVLIAFLLLLTTMGYAQEKKEALTVKEMVFCIAVEDRQPIGVDTVFSNTVERVYCFTKIIGARDTTSVTHVWYFEDEEKARVHLPVKSISWRTWSCKTMLSAWVGIWRVDVESSDGEVLRSKSFIIKPESG